MRVRVGNMERSKEGKKVGGKEILGKMTSSEVDYLGGGEAGGR